MKHRTLVLVSAAIFHCFAINAQTATTGQTAATPYAVVELGANYQVWQRVSWQTNQSGLVSVHTNSYTELATGLHFWQNGQWANSKEEVDLLPGGGAAATNGQHQVYFPADIYNGLIEIVTPDGKQLNERPLGISYFDGTNSVMFALLTNSVGQILPSGNQVIYPNAFTGVAADLVCTYRKAGFECDLVFREQPPAPDQFGLNPTDSRLELMTEFVDSPAPTSVSQTVDPANGLVDQTLDFGSLEMVPGKAFLTGGSQDSSPTLRVCKQWTQIDGRTFLIEELPYSQIETELQTLPAPAASVAVSAKNNRLHLASVKRLLPASRPVMASKSSVQLASVNWNRKSGVVLDYNTLNTTQSNFTFQADTTYFISGLVALYGTTTIEGGTVIKFTNYSANLYTPYGATVNCLTGPYRMAILTAMDDNSVGDAISGSSGAPSGYYASYAFENMGPLTLQYLRISYANDGISGYGGTFNHMQFVSNAAPVTLISGTAYLRNVLMYGVSDYCFSANAATINAQNLTVHDAALLGPGSYGNLYLTNSLLICVTNCAFTGTGANFYSGNNYTNSSDAGMFQTVGAGGHYLTTNSLFAGTTNIDPNLLAALQTKTVYPPTVLTNITVSTNTTLTPQVPRDTNAVPYMGYHYDPLDYITDVYGITNAALTITNGVAIACYDETGIWLQNGSSIVSVGTPLKPNWFVRYQSVQEQPVVLGGSAPYGGLSITQYQPGGGGQSAYFRFSDFTCPAGGGTQFQNEDVNWVYSSLRVQDCQIWGGNNNFDNSGTCTTVFDDNLLFRSTVSASGANGSYSTLAFSNNLFYGASSVFLPEGTTNNWLLVFNNDFDSCSPSCGRSTCSNGFNAYLNCGSRLSPTSAYDVVSGSTLAYETGPLGNFYQPTNSPLINWGSTTADLVGLYEYTVTTNMVAGLEVKETNSVVDIGYHYVATDANGNPIDTSGVGIPDYVADVHGNGIYEPVITLQPASQTIDDGSNATFTVTVTGTAPLSYQWQFDGTAIPSATNATFTLPSVRITDAGNYSVIVTNSVGSVTSSIANLIVVPTMVVAWGTNSSGECNVPLGLTNALTVAGGINFSLALLDNGTVLGWGDNTYGQTNVPAGLTNITAIAAGGYHALALRKNGTVVAWGGDVYGETNVPTGLTNVTAIAAGYAYSMALQSNGMVVAWGDNTYGQTNVPALGTVTQISAGWYHGVALLTNGTVAAWGLNDFVEDGEPLGLNITNVPTGLSNVVSIAGGGYHTLALETNGTVVAWGAGVAGTTNLYDYGQSAVPAGLSNVVAVAAGGFYSLALQSSGTVVAWGSPGDGETTVPAYLTGVDAIAAGAYHALAIRSGILTPVIIAEPDNEYALAGGTVTFSSEGEGVAGVTYQWQFSGMNISGATNESLTLTNTQTTNNGSYQVIISDSAGSVTSSIAMFTLITPPVITSMTMPTNQVASFQTNLILEVTVTAPGQANGYPLVYQWLFNGTNFIGSTSNSYSILIDTNSPGTYSVTVTNAAGGTGAVWQVTMTYAGSYIAPGTLAYYLSTNAVGYASGHSGSSTDMLEVSNWTYGFYSTTNMAALTNAVWSTNFWLHGVQGLSATSIGISNNIDGGLPYDGSALMVTMVSPRHYLRATHTGVPPGMIAFLDTNNVIYWRTNVQQVDIGSDTSVGILNADLPPSVGYLQVLPSNFTNYLPTTSYSYVQGIGMNQYASRFGQAMTFGDPVYVYWNGTSTAPFGLSTNWNILIVDGDSSDPEALVVSNKLVLVAHNYTSSAGPNYAYQIDAINQQMHYLSTNNSVGTDYQLTQFSLTNWPIIH